MERIAVIGGTKYDTNIGCLLIRERGLRCDGYPMANTAEEQNRLQYFSKHELQSQIEKRVKELERNKYDTLLIFCSSLSVAIDQESLSRATQIRIISPIDIFKTLAHKFDRFFIIVANGQSLFGVERVMLDSREDVEIFGFSNLALVNSIEKGLSPEVIFQEFHLHRVIDLAVRLSVQSIVLGCTHLASLYKLIKNNSPIPVIDVGREMVKCLVSYEKNKKTRSTDG